MTETPPVTPPEQGEARLNALRGEIDAADGEILRLLNRRALLSLEVGRVKRRMSGRGKSGIIFDPLRERQVLENLASRNTGPLPRQHIDNIWREIFSSSRVLQRPQRVAYLGPEGTFSHHAAMEFLGASQDFVPQGDLAGIFRAVQDQSCDMGIVPLENSLQGSVGQVLDLFLEYDLSIQAELFGCIDQCLLSLEASPAAVHTVYSHSQPLAQCGNWLRANLPGADLIPVESTAAAARRAAREEGTAAIGHRGLADILQLRVLARHIHDAPNNRTRFAVIGRQIRAPERRGVSGADPPLISSLLFTLPDRPGALAAVLNTMARAGLNLRKLESRPLPKENWKYVFFADVECDLLGAEQGGLPEKLAAICAQFRILGVYPAGPCLNRTEEDPHDHNRGSAV